MKSARPSGPLFPPSSTPPVKVTFIYPIVKAVYVAPAPTPATRAIKPTIETALYSRKERISAARHTSVSTNAQTRDFSTKPEAAHLGQSLCDHQKLENSPLVRFENKQARQFSLPLSQAVFLRPEIRNFSTRTFSTRKLSAALEIHLSNKAGVAANESSQAAALTLKASPKKDSESDENDKSVDEVLGLFNDAFRSFSVASVKDTTTVSADSDITSNCSATESSTTVTCASTDGSHTNTSVTLQQDCSAWKPAPIDSSFGAYNTKTGLPPTMEESPYSSTDDDTFEFSITPAVPQAGRELTSRFYANDETFNTTLAVPADQDAYEYLSGLWKYSGPRTSLLQDDHNTPASETINEGEEIWEDIDLGDDGPSTSDSVHVSTTQEFLDAVDNFKREVWTPAARGWRSMVNSAARKFDVEWIRGGTST
ncbi:hypothetical protein BZA70DRAFT_280035 [Myxozyma melibiosi]|uniref:Uncharacterized protein n=1 Tax=Myxozyma melibiosi TaxID=54550 RepID=A0ABR1F4P5_9ASCO